jgi:glycosyltransferase involved in cell wall biosynthesis
MAKFILYLPYSEFIDAYIHKALGAIPISFRDIGLETEIIVGQMKSNEYRHLGIKVHETGNLDSKYVVKNSQEKMHIAPRLLNLLNFTELKTVLKILVNERPDIIMAFNNSTLTGLIMFRYKIYSRMHGIKTNFILKLDSDGTDILSMGVIGKLLIYLYYFSLSFAFDRIITETTCGYDIFKHIPGIKNKLRIVPNSVSDDFLKEYDEGKREKNIITVSRIDPDKGLDILIKAFTSIAKSNQEWNLEIIGPISNEDYYNQLLKLINETGFSDRIKFLGPFNRKNLINKYSSSSIFCLASRHESFAISRLEAISMGMYVISTTAGCAQDFSKYRIHTVPTNDVKAMAEAINTAIQLFDSGTFKTEKHKNIPSYSGIASSILEENF